MNRSEICHFESPRRGGEVPAIGVVEVWEFDLSICRELHGNVRNGAVVLISISAMYCVYNPPLETTCSAQYSDK